MYNIINTDHLINTCDVHFMKRLLYEHTKDENFIALAGAVNEDMTVLPSKDGNKVLVCKQQQLDEEFYEGE